MAGYCTKEKRGGSMKNNKNYSIIRFIIALILLILFLSPLLIIVLGSFKTYSEIMTNAISLPKEFSFDNFKNVFRDMNYPKAFLNTAIVTLLGTTGIVIVGSFAGYMLSRTKQNSATYCLFSA